MPASTVRFQIESALTPRIPSALTPVPRMMRPVAPTGVPAVDELLEGGLPLGAIIEMSGPESSGRTALALSYIARVTHEGNVCAWIDACDALHAESASAAGVDLSRLLWVRCGATSPLKQTANYRPVKPWTRLEQALGATDILLQAGGFSAVVLDMAGIAPEYVSRIELSIWFRYRAAVGKTRASLLLLTQHSCAKSAGELLLRFHPGEARRDERTVFTGIEHRLEVERRRFAESESDAVPLKRQPQRSSVAYWHSQSTWVGAR